MPKVFHPVARIGEVAPGELRYIEVAAKAICLANVDGEILAIDNTCTHEGASLSEGTLAGTRLECPVHGGVFDAFSGEPLRYPVVHPVKTYSVEIEDGVISVGIRT